jgi:hypothetical protein
LVRIVPILIPPLTDSILPVLESAEFLVKCDSISRDNEVDFDFMRRSQSSLKKAWAHVITMLGTRHTGAISLPEGDQTLGLAASSILPIPTSSQFSLPRELGAEVTRWAGLSADWNHHRALWISAEAVDKSSEIAVEVSRVLAPNVSVVDVSEARSIFWPLVYGLARASSYYREEVYLHPPVQFSGVFSILAFYGPTFSSYERFRAPWPNDEDATVRISFHC